MDRDNARDQKIWSLLLDDACHKIADHLDRAGQPFLMLKGAVIAAWLYPEPSDRTYTDLDILIPPDTESAVVALLGELGYEPLLDSAALRVISPDEQPLRNHLGVVVDLHLTLKGIRAPAARAWEILSADALDHDWTGRNVPTLAEPARAMHLALHVAQRGAEDTKAVRDLELGIRAVDQATWHRARELARELDALEAFSAGLHLLPSGAGLADRLALAPPSDTATLMTADASVFRPAVALERLLATGSWPQRLRTAWAYLFPSTDWLRHTDPRAGTSAGALLMARVRRPFRVLSRVVAAAHDRRRFKREHGL